MAVFPKLLLPLFAEAAATVVDRESSSSPDDGETTSSGSTGPYASKHLQIENVIRKEEDSFSDVYFVGECEIIIQGPQEPRQ